MCSLLLLFIISTLAFYTGFVVGSKKEEQQQKKQVEVKNVHKDIEETISKLNIKFENIVKAQIILESGNLTSIRAIRDLSLIHISEPTRLLSISYAVFCLKKKNTKQQILLSTRMSHR